MLWVFGHQLAEVFKKTFFGTLHVHPQAFVVKLCLQEDYAQRKGFGFVLLLEVSWVTFVVAQAESKHKALHYLRFAWGVEC